MVQSPRQLFESQRYKELCDCFADSVPDSVDVWELLGRAQLAQGQCECAIGSLEQAITLDPTRTSVHYYRACALARLHRWMDVELSLVPCVDDEEFRDRALSTRAQARVSADLWAEALEDYSDLASRGKIESHDRIGFAACLLQTGEFSRCESIIQNVLGGTRAPEVAWLIFGRSLEGQRRWSEAAIAYADGLEQHFDSEILSQRLIATGRRPSARRPDWLLRSRAGRQEVMQKWLDRQRLDPSDRAVMRHLAIISSYTAQKSDAVRHKSDRALWATAVANWSILLSDADWQRDFARKRAEVYGREVGDHELAVFAQQLREHVEELLAASSREHSAIGQPSLRVELMRERAAIDACKTTIQDGGLKLPGVTDPMACGPLFLRELEFQGRFGDLLGSLRHATPDSLNHSWDDPRYRDTSEMQLRRLFSSLGYAQSQLSQDPTGAIRSLRWVICPNCATAATRASPREIIVCDSKCDAFAERNPGFAEYGSPAEKLKVAVEWLRLQAYVAAANQAISLATPDLRAVVKYWSEASEFCADGTNRKEALLQHIQDHATQRFTELVGSERSAAAVELADQLRSKMQLVVADDGTLAFALTEAGIQKYNEENDFDYAVAQLERAVELNPAMVRSRENLIRILSHDARGALLHGEDLERGQLSLQRAKQCLRDAQDRSISLAAELSDEIRLIEIEAIVTEAAADYSNGKYRSAVDAMREALGLAETKMAKEENSKLAEDHAQRIRQYLATGYTALGNAAMSEGDKQEARQCLERAAHYNPDDQELREKIEEISL